MDTEKRILLCQYIAMPGKIVALETPTMSNELTCPVCHKAIHALPLFDPKISDDRVWMCINSFCEVATFLPQLKPQKPESSRAIEWPKFCELNELGDVYYSILFEELKQPLKITKQLNAILLKPKGTALFQGPPGTGKTYSALSVCEKFTRTNPSAIFITQRKLADRWLDHSRNGNSSQFINSLENCNLLIIDDFGSAIPSPIFLSFFMDVLNTRNQWSNRATIVTTNLQDLDLVKIGDSLADRLSCGEIIAFSGKSRRK